MHSSMDAAKAARAALCEDADVLLCCNCNKELPAHRALLRLVSPVLRVAVDTLSSGSKEVIPVDEDADTWEHALCLLYHIVECPDMDLASAERLLRLSHKYNIKGVEMHCMRVVLAHDFHLAHQFDTACWPDVQSMNLADDSVLRWLVLADRLGSDELMDKCLACIRDALPAAYFDEWGEAAGIQPFPPGTLARTATVPQLICTPEFVNMLKPTTVARVMGCFLLALGAQSKASHLS